MKKLFFLILPFALLLGCSDESSNNNSTLPPTSPASTIHVLPESYDFGTVKYGETKTTNKFIVATNGFVTSRYDVSNDILGLDSTSAENALKTMAENLTTNGTFTLTLTPICKGSLTGELFIVTDISGGASVRVPITANVTDDTNTLPNCSSDTPVITVTTTPENVIQTGLIQGVEGNQKYINFDTIADKTVTITSESDTYLTGGTSGSSLNSTFNYNVTSWKVENNKVTATAAITFNPANCSGPASDRVRVNGINGTEAAEYLYVAGTGTGTGTACSNKYPLQ